MSVCVSVFLKATYHVDRHENMDFRLLKSSRNQDFGGANEPLCKMTHVVRRPSKALTHYKFQKCPNIELSYNGNKNNDKPHQ